MSVPRTRTEVGRTSGARFVAEIDERVLRWTEAHRAAPLTVLFRGAAHAGQLGLAWVAAGFLLERRGAASRSQLGLGNAAATWSAYGASLLVSRLVRRERPCHQRASRALVSCPDGPSLPSDQAAAAVASALTLARSAPQARLVLAAAAATAGFARLYLGVHYPSDVAAGAVLGASAALVARSI
jgi:membrane-associated phospholipid phosphatase